MVFEIGIRFIACASKTRLGTAVVATGLRSSGDWAANAHFMTFRDGTRDASDSTVRGT